MRAGIEVNFSAQRVEALGNCEAVITLCAFIQHVGSQPSESRGIIGAEGVACGEATDEGDHCIDGHIDGDDLNIANGSLLHLAREVDCCRARCCS